MKEDPATCPEGGRWPAWDEIRARDSASGRIDEAKVAEHRRQMLACAGTLDSPAGPGRPARTLTRRPAADVVAEAILPVPAGGAAEEEEEAILVPARPGTVRTAGQVWALGDRLNAAARGEGAGRFVALPPGSVVVSTRTCPDPARHAPGALSLAVPADMAEGGERVVAMDGEWHEPVPGLQVRGSRGGICVTLRLTPREDPS